jgi:NADPH:quinone reductase-like Zn-dependent oxidoreductase
MRAAVYSEYGPADVLRSAEVDPPVPKDDEVLIRVRAAALNPLDRHFMRGRPYLLRLALGLRAPGETRLGVDVAGTVEAIGKNVEDLRPGDDLFGAGTGSFAEYACAPAWAVARKGDKLTFEEAAACNIGGVTALQGLRDKGRVQPGQEVLINGAAGGVGTFAVQLARHFGADVTGVCSTKNVEMIRSLGAGRVIDYTREDFTKGAARYDLIFDCVGKGSLAASRRVLKPNGRLIIVGGRTDGLLDPLPFMLSALLLPRCSLFLSKRSRNDLMALQELVEAGTIRPVIDRRYPLADIAAAMRYLDAGHVSGKVVITVE